MNTLRTLLMTALIAVTLVACDKDESKGNEHEVEGTYRGLFSVQNNGEIFELNGAFVVIEETANDTVSIIMKKVKFAERMPLLDITIAGVSATKTPEGFLLSGNDIIPEAMGGPFEDYRITNLEGTIIGDNLDFTMICGEYPVSYSGTSEP